MSARNGKPWLKYFLFFLLIFFTAGVYALPAEDVELINDKDYFPKVHQLFARAEKSIFVIMFSARYYDNYADSQSNILLFDLAAAKKRGADVKVILEQGPPLSGNWFGKPKIEPEQHQRVVRFLEEHKIPYKLDSPDTVTHAKLILIDGIYTVIGSTNWSYSALAKNNETAVIIKSRPVAEAYTRYFETLYKK